MALAETLIDNFDDNTQDTGLWSKTSQLVTPDPLVTVLEQNTRLEIQPRVNVVNAYNGYVSVNTYDLTNSGVVVDVTAHTGGAGIEQETVFVVQLDSNNRFFFDKDNDNLQFYAVVATTATNPGPQTYSSTTHRWWRIRHLTAGDLIKWDTSPDGTNWTERRSLARPFAITAMRISLEGGTYGAVAAPTVSIFDNVGGLNPVTWEQEGFRWRNDDGSETTATYLAAQDTPL